MTIEHGRGRLHVAPVGTPEDGDAWVEVGEVEEVDARMRDQLATWLRPEVVDDLARAEDQAAAEHFILGEDTLWDQEQAKRSRLSQAAQQAAQQAAEHFMSYHDPQRGRAVDVCAHAALETLLAVRVMERAKPIAYVCPVCGDRLQPADQDYVDLTDRAPLPEET